MLTVKTYFWVCQALMTSYGLLSPLYTPATLNIVIYQCWEKDERNGRALYFLTSFPIFVLGGLLSYQLSVNKKISLL